MNEISKKVEYLKGYAEGLGAEFKSDEGKIIEKLLDIISDMAEEIENLSADICENRELIDEIDDTLLLIADDIYGDDIDDEDDMDFLDDDDDELFDLFDDDDDDDEDFDFSDEELDDENSDLFEIQCPECHEDFMVEYDELVDGGVIRCPHCEKRVELEIDFTESDEEDDEWDF